MSNRVLLEYVSADPTGPITIHHARAGVAGDILARAFAAQGAEVFREYYCNDASGPGLEDFLRRAAPGDPFAARLSAGPGAPLDTVERLHLDSLSGLGVSFDRVFRESSLVSSGAVLRMVESLVESGRAERRGGAIWLRSSDLGDSQDRVLVRANGSPTYLAGDLAYHRDKLERGFDHLVNLWDGEHAGYVARTHAGLAALGADPGALTVALVYPVRVLQGGTERRTGRAGGAFTLEEALAVAPAAAVRLRLALFPLSESAFLDLDEAARDPILQRLRSATLVARTATETDPALVFVRSKAAALRDAIAAAVRDLAPNRLAEYALELAGAINAAGRATAGALAALDRTLDLLGLEDLG